jgi:hypothetical protein
MKNETFKNSIGSWIAIIGIVIATLGLVNNIVDRKVDEINVKFDRVEKKIDNIDANFNNHLQYHIEKKECKNKEVSYAEVTVKAPKTTREEDTQSTR